MYSVLQVDIRVGTDWVVPDALPNEFVATLQGQLTIPWSANRERVSFTRFGYVPLEWRKTKRHRWIAGAGVSNPCVDQESF